MKNIKSKYISWELENEKEFYILAEHIEHGLAQLKKYLNVFLFFVNIVSKKVLKLSFIVFKVLFSSSSLKKHIGPEYLAEDVYINNNNSWFRH